jgi:hypothetical protein
VPFPGRGRLPRAAPSSSRAVHQRRTRLAYLLPFRPPKRSRPLADMVSRTASGGGRVGETEALRLNFASFGFFGSRLDRLCPFAIGGSPDARDQRYRTPFAERTDGSRLLFEALTLVVALRRYGGIIAK